MSNLLIPSFLVSNVSESLRSLTKNEWCDRIAQVAHQKRATMSDSLRLLTKNERPWVNHSGRSPKMSDEQIARFFEWIARILSKLLIRSFFCKNKLLAQKTDERIPSPDLDVNHNFFLNKLNLFSFRLPT